MRLVAILLTLASLARASWATCSCCLPGALGVRKNLTDAAGQSFPLGFVVPDWSSGKLTSALWEILAGEILGYGTRVNDVAISSSIPAMYALLGCATWMNPDDRGCSTRSVRDHVLSDSWYTTFVPVVEAINEQYEGESPVIGGSMGYLGNAGTYVPQSVLKAGAATGAAMEYYKSYDASWHQPWKFFDNITSFNVSRDFMPCAASILSDNSTMHTYMKLSGDLPGVVLAGGSYKALCEDGYTWKSPSCRSSSAESCVVWITGGDGWDAVAGMQQATAFNMPLIITVARSWSKYLELPGQITTLFWWWTPDDSFVDIAAEALILPPHDALAQGNGDRRSSTAQVEIAKVISADLESMAPDLVQLLRKSTIQLEEVNDMMRSFKANKSATRHDVACRWLKENQARWQSWLPDPTRCSPGHGLSNGAEFVASRDGAISCKKCPPGSYSKAFSDGDLTYVCTPCDAGSYQEFGTSLSCIPCPRGEYQDQQGSRSCTRCGIGFYQDVVGQSECRKCPADTTTLGIGSVVPKDCACKEGTINIAEEAVQCVACGEGMSCPFSSSITSLLLGDSTLGPSFTPALLQGYVASREQPLSVHKCMKNCPGGKPGTCAAGLQGRTCAVCPEGQTWTGDACTACHPEIIILWILAALCLLCALLASYHVVNSVKQQRATVLEALGLSLGLAAYMLQSVAVVGLMTVRWTPSFADTSSSLKVLLLNFKGMSIGCVTGAGDLAEFAVTAAIFPLCTLWIFCWWAVSRALPCWKPWVLFKTFNTMGVFLQVGFTTMVAVAVKPVMCYSHPNGLYSIVEYPNVICGESQQVSMMIIGFVLMSFAVAFLALCGLAAMRIPAWSLQASKMVGAFRFLAGKFRLSSWWFGLVLLARSVSFSLAVALFANAPEIQAAVGSTVLLVYLGWLIAMWPWKVPILNHADAVVTGSLLLLMGHAKQDGGAPHTKFVEGLSMALLLLIFVSIALLLCLNLVVLLASKSYHQRLLNVGVSLSSEEVAKALSRCADELQQVELADLQDDCAALNSVDLTVIGTAITIISMELVDSANPLTNRVQSKAISTRLTTVAPDAACSRQTSPGEEQIAQEVPPENKVAMVSEVL